MSRSCPGVRAEKARPRCGVSSSRVVVAAILAGASLGSTGCASQRGDQVKVNAQAFRKEQGDAQRLLGLGRGFASVGDLTRAEEYFDATMDAGANPIVLMPMLLPVCVAERHVPRCPFTTGYNHLRQASDRITTRDFVLGSSSIASTGGQ